MQPQTHQPSNPQYDFILKDNQQPKKGLGLPRLNLPKPVAIGLAVLMGLIVIVLASSLLFGNKGSKYQSLTDLANQEQEIIRVTALAQPQLSDPATQALAATTEASVSSDQAQIIKYLKAHKVKVDTKKLTKYLNKATDSQFQTASQNNTSDKVFIFYLKSNLASYKAKLSSSYQSVPASAKSILSSAYTNASTLLAEPPLI